MDNLTLANNAAIRTLSASCLGEHLPPISPIKRLKPQGGVELSGANKLRPTIYTSSNVASIGIYGVVCLQKRRSCGQ